MILDHINTGILDTTVESVLTQEPTQSKESHVYLTLADYPRTSSFK